MDCPIGYHIISHYTKLALVQASVGDRDVQGTSFFDKKHTLFEWNFEEKKEVKFEGENLVAAEAIVVIRGYIPHTSLIQAEERNFLLTETMCSDACTRLKNTLASLESFHLQGFKITIIHSKLH